MLRRMARPVLILVLMEKGGSLGVFPDPVHRVHVLILVLMAKGGSNQKHYKVMSNNVLILVIVEIGWLFDAGSG